MTKIAKQPDAAATFKLRRCRHDPDSRALLTPVSSLIEIITCPCPAVKAWAKKIRRQICGKALAFSQRSGIMEKLTRVSKEETWLILPSQSRLPRSYRRSRW